MVKKILLGIVGLVVLLLVIAAFAPKKAHLERSIVIEASPEAIYPHVTHFSKRTAWYPWSQLDPNMESRVEGTDGQEGATYHWSGNKDVGVGHQTLTSLEANKRLETDLVFEEPFESKANTFMTLDAEEGGTKVVWGFDSKFPYPMNLMLLTGGMQKAIGKDYDKGLASLKKIVEEEQAGS